MRAQKKQLDPVSSKKPCFKCPGCDTKVFENVLIGFTTEFRDDKGNLIATDWDDVKDEVTTYLKECLIENGKNEDGTYKGVIIKDAVLYSEKDITDWFRKARGNMFRIVKQHLVDECKLNTDEFIERFPFFTPGKTSKKKT
jgi:hypothetical protein